MNKVFNLHEPPLSTLPLFLDSPHSGTHYPDDFAHICPRALLRQTEDMFVDSLLADMPARGIGTLCFNVARSYVDVNRARDDIEATLVEGRLPFTLRPTERSFAGHGLLRSTCRGQPVYGGPLPAAAILRRITDYYDVYHAALATALQQLHKTHGRVFLINCHSMPSGQASPLLPWGVRKSPDMVIGDLNGHAAEAGFVSTLAGALRSKGYSVAHNDPYRGVEVVRRWGRPREGFHAVQLEVNRALYMDEEKLAPLASFAHVKADLEDVFMQLKGWLMQPSSEDRLAAE